MQLWSNGTFKVKGPFFEFSGQLLQDSFYQYIIFCFWIKNYIIVQKNSCRNPLNLP